MGFAQVKFGKGFALGSDQFMIVIIHYTQKLKSQMVALLTQ